MENMAIILIKCPIKIRSFLVLCFMSRSLIRYPPFLFSIFLTTLLEMKRAFSMFDQNNDGTISVNEIKAIFTAFGLDTTEEQLNKLMKEADVDGKKKMRMFYNLDSVTYVSD